MALFDSLRPGNGPLAIVRGLPSMQHSKLAKQVNRLRRLREWCDYWHLWETEERLKKSHKVKQAECLAAITKTWAELPLPPATEAEFRFVDSALAYVILPKLVFMSFDTVRAICHLQSPPGALVLFDYACSELKVRPEPDRAASYFAHHLFLFSRDPHEFYILGYPEPSTANSADATSPPTPNANEEPLVYPPEMSVVLRERKRGRLAYFVLGQSPKLGSVLRSVKKIGDELRIGLLGAVDDDQLWERISELARQESTWT